MGLDSASAADRVRPGADNPCVKFTFTTSASAFQSLRTKPSQEMNPPVYVSVKCTANCHIIFGAAAVRAPTTADALFEPTDGWTDWMLLSDDTGFRVIGASAGDVYIFFSGR
jgi:hypothetical protein